MIKCISCDSEIDAERLEVLPDTKSCVKCSREPVSIGFMEYGHKTAGYVQIIKGNDQEGLRRAQRAFRRAR